MPKTQTVKKSTKVTPLPFSQWWFMDRMKELGYDINVGGMCYGMAHMAVQAVLVGDEDVFEERLQFLNRVPKNQLANLVLQARKRYSQLHPPKIHDTRVINGKTTFAVTKSPIKQAFQNKIVSKIPPLTFDEIQYLRIPPFFDGIQLYQSNSEYSEITLNRTSNQDATKVMEFLMPQNLLAEKGIVVAKNTCGSYTPRELVNYFDELKSVITQEKYASLKNIPIVINNINHAITVFYDKKKQEWCLVDANRLPVQRFKDTQLFVNAVFLSYGVLPSLLNSKDSSAPVIAMRKTIYATGKEQPFVESLLDTWSKRKKIAELHEVTLEKIQRRDRYDCNWLCLAIKNNMTDVALDIIKQMQEKMKDDDLKNDINHTMGDVCTALSEAIIYRNLAVVKKLLPIANLDSITKSGHNVLYIAAKHGGGAVMEEVLKHYKKIEVEFYHDKGTPLALACAHSDVDCVKQLIAAGADVSRRSLNNDPPLYLAILRGDADIVRALCETKKIDYNITCSNGLSLLDIAVAHENKSIHEILGHAILHWMCETDNIIKLKEALANGVKLEEMKDSDGKSLEDIAMGCLNVNVLRLIEKSREQTSAKLEASLQVLDDSNITIRKIQKKSRRKKYEDDDEGQQQLEQGQQSPKYAEVEPVKLPSPQASPKYVFPIDDSNVTKERGHKGRGHKKKHGHGRFSFSPLKPPIVAEAPQAPDQAPKRDLIVPKFSLEDEHDAPQKSSPKKVANFFDKKPNVPMKNSPLKKQKQKGEEQHPAIGKKRGMV